MSYYVRAFCTHGDSPPLGQLLSFAAERGASLTLDPEVSSPDVDDGDWEQVGVVYKEHKASILFEVNRDKGDESLMREEIEEFTELLEDTPKGRNLRRVEKHLRKTRFIIAARLPVFDVDDDGYAALGHVLTFLVENNGAMIQADGEGFYEGGKVVVVLD